MATLQFAYAGPDTTQLPEEIAEALPSRKWKVSVSGLEGIREISPAPDFMWVDLGAAPKISAARSVLADLAGLQKTAAGTHSFVFISGSHLPPSAHHKLAEGIYSAMPDPAEVVTDLAGSPDLWSALAKFLAMRQKRRLTGLRTPAKTVHSGPSTVPLPNVDLRTERGRLSIRLIAGLFGMDVIEIGRLIGRSGKAALSKTPDADSLQQALQPFADIALLRGTGFGDEDFRKWLHSRNEHLENRSPIDWIRDGHINAVAGFVYGILTGQPA